MADQLVSQPDHGDSIIEILENGGRATPRLQLFFDDITRILGDLTASSGGSIEPSNFDPSSVIYRPSTGTDILPAVINESEFLGRLPGGEIEGLGFVDAWSILGNGSGNVTLNQVGGAVNFTVESNLSSTMFRVDGSNNRVGIALNGLSPTDGLVHILNSVAGGGTEGPVEANSNGDDLVLERDFNGGMSILNGSDSRGNIFFGSPSWGNAAGNLWFLHDKSSGGSANEAISSITDSAGKARFNFTPPPTVLVGQNVTIAGFVTNTDYNGTFTVLATGSGYIEVASGPFSIPSVTNSGGTARFNFSGPTVSNGDIVEIASFVINTAYNGTHTITATDGTSYFETVTAFGSDEAGEFSHYVQWGTNEAGGNFFVIGDGAPTFGADVLEDTFFELVNDTVDGSGSGFFVNPNQDTLIDFQVNTFTSAPFLRVDSAADRLGISTTSLAPDQGTVHIIEGDTGATALTTGDLLIFEFLGGGNGISFLTENVSQGRICWGDPQESNKAIFQYNHFEQSGVGAGDDFGWQFFFNNFSSEILRMNQTEGVVVNYTNNPAYDFTVRAVNHDSLFKCDVTGGGRVGVSNSGILPSHGVFHVVTGDAVIIPDGNYDEIIVEGAGQAGISILGGAASESGIAWGGNGFGATAGLISVVPSTWVMNLKTNTVSRLTLSPSECVFNDTGVDTDLRVESINSVQMLLVDAGLDLVSISDASIKGTDGLLHLIQTGLAGSVTASTAANVLVMEASTAQMGMSFLSPDTSIQYTVYGDASVNNEAWIQYSHTDDIWSVVMGSAVDAFSIIKGTGSVFNNAANSAYDLRAESGSNDHKLFLDAGIDELQTAAGQAPTALADIGGKLNVNNGTQGTTAVTTEETLHSYSLPANSLTQDGRGVRIKAWGTTAANANNKTVKLKFGATAVLDTGAVASNNETWHFVAEVFRTGAATQDAVSFVSHYNGTVIQAQITNPAETLSGAVTIAVTGQNGTASANDIVAEGFTVEYI